MEDESPTLIIWWVLEFEQPDLFHVILGVSKDL